MILNRFQNYFIFFQPTLRHRGHTDEKTIFVFSWIILMIMQIKLAIFQPKEINLLHKLKEMHFIIF